MQAQVRKGGEKAPPRLTPGGNASLSLLAIAWGALLGAWYLAEMWPVLWKAGPLGQGLWGVKTALEVLASFYLISNVLKSLAYLRSRATGLRGQSAPPPSHRFPTVGLVYLCCDDLDIQALESLFRVRYQGPLFLVVHDDSRSPEARQRIERALEALEERYGRSCTLLRRPLKTGGKPGAVNYVLEHAGWLFQYFMLCDNDSIALQPDFIPRALAYFDDPRVAIVQFRSRGVAAAGARALERHLARAVDAFDVFMRGYARFGLTPFLGHNAMLRTQAVIDAGAFTEGFFSDDIDLTLRLAGRGLRVAYAPEIEVGERHPASNAAFLLRSRKWAYGCMQVLRRHLRQVLASPTLRLRDKLWFLEFAGFYFVQALLTPYLLISYVAIPLLSRPFGLPIAHTALFGTLVLLSIMSPTLALSVADRRLREWPAMAWSCALVYGGSVVASTLGVIDHFRSVVREWVPTNRSHASPGLARLAVAQAVFGIALFAIPLWAAPDLLLTPSSYIFISIFLFSPLVSMAYRPPAHGRARQLSPGSHALRSWHRLGRSAAGAIALLRFWSLLLAAAGLLMLSSEARAAPGHPANGSRRAPSIPPSSPSPAVATPPARAFEAQAGAVEARDGALWVEGARFLVRGIHYSPWLPGTGPMKNYAWPGRAVLDEDFRRLRELRVNTILVHDAPDAAFDLAQAARLRVIYAFSINWQSIQDDAAFAARERQILARVDELRGRPALLLWVLGNEIPEWVVRKYGPALLEKRLRSLYEAVKALDPAHPITHSNWPITRDLDLGFMDVAAFNLYPLWPREVVVRGYGGYIEDVLKPLARGKPLLITEFGVNTIESREERQAEILRACWRDIERLTAGGVAFEFVDEWWKNYDNPIREGDWWQRQYAPDDEKTQDLDPEEYYGIMTSERIPKPAFAAVREMFTPPVQGPRPRTLLVVPLVVLLIYTVYVFWRRV